MFSQLGRPVEHLALRRRQRLVDRPIDHKDVDEEEPAQVELGREREGAVNQLGA